MEIRKNIYENQQVSKFINVHAVSKYVCEFVYKIYNYIYFLIENCFSDAI